MAKGKNQAAFVEPFPLDKTTWVRNFIPHSYPKGTGIGMDWQNPGGFWDSTDPRDPVCWGAPLPKRGDQRPGENRENCIRRLKLEGYVGLYKRIPIQASEPPAVLTRLGRIAQIAAAAEHGQDTRQKVEPTTKPEDPDHVEKGSKPTRSQTRSRSRKAQDTAPVAPVTAVVPKKPRTAAHKPESAPEPASDDTLPNTPEAPVTAPEEVVSETNLELEFEEEKELEPAPEQVGTEPATMPSGDSVALGQSLIKRGGRRAVPATQPEA